jgi:hypothetical protein
MTILLLFCTGCQFAVVRSHAVDLDAEIPALYNQLMLDNVAMAIESPDNMPYFGTVGQNQVTNARTASIGVTPSWTWAATVTKALSMPFTGQDQNQAAIQLTPVNSADKLELLRELFVAAACSYRCPYTEVSDYFSPLKRYYDTNSVAIADYSKAVFSVDPNNPIDRSGKPPQPVCVDATPCVAAHMEPGRWPTRYLFKEPWLCVTTSEHAVPKGACCVGHYCNTYVYPPPGKGEQLRRLTMAALDIANNDLSQMKFSTPPPDIRPSQQGLRTNPQEFRPALAPAIQAAPTISP